MRGQIHHRCFETSKGNITTDSKSPAVTGGLPLAVTGHQEPPSCPKSCRWCSSIWQNLEPVMEPSAQIKVGHHFLETKSNHLVLPETASLTVKLKNVPQIHLWKEANNRIVLKAVFSLSSLSNSIVVIQDCYSVSFCKME